jgi:hypothetical protein
MRLMTLTENPSEQIDECFRMDIFDQYEAKVKQHIAFLIAESLATIPIEEIIIILETMDLDEYLKT